MPDTLAPTAPATDLTDAAQAAVTPTAPEAEPTATDLAEALVEEVSIDGMCGVY